MFVFIFRNRISKRAQAIAATKRDLAPMISEFLFYNEDSSLEEKSSYLNQKIKIRELIKSRFNREVLAEILTDLQKDVSGEARYKIYKLYKDLGLQHDAFAKLKSWRWEVISQGILELTQMRVEDSYMFIRRFVNHRKGIIRKQAQIATVSLKHEGIGFLLDTCSYQISEWQQLKLMDVLRNLDDFTPPRFKIWLTSSNKDVVLFSLRLIRYYNQNDANQALVELLKHRNSQIKAEAILCLKDFGVTESIDMLKAIFRKCGTAEKIAILDALATLGSHNDIEFLKKIENGDHDFTVRSKALSAINVLVPGTILPTKGLDEPSASDFEFAIDEQVQDDSSTASEPGMGDKITDAIPDDIPEIYDENPAIFDLCVREEFEDILDEVTRQDDPEFLSLSFLPIVEVTDKEMTSTSDDFNGNKPSGELDEEEKFIEDLDSILNNITMKNSPDKPEHEEIVPDFLPRVISNEDADELQANKKSTREIEVVPEPLEGPVTSGLHPEISGGASDENDKEFETNVEENSGNLQNMIAGERKDLLENQESANSQEPCEDSYGFSIFHEMFRDFDSESKLILLDEILVVGEEKELCFLGSLANDPDKKVRKKASKIRELLAEKFKKGPAGNGSGGEFSGSTGSCGRR